MPDPTVTRQSRSDSNIDNVSSTAMQPAPRDEQEPGQTYNHGAEAPAAKPGTFLLALFSTSFVSNFSVFDLRRKRPQPAASPKPKKSVQ